MNGFNLIKKEKIKKIKKHLHQVVYRDNISEHLIGNRCSLRDGALEKRLTHMPFTHAFTGSNPVRVTILSVGLYIRLFFYKKRSVIHFALFFVITGPLIKNNMAVSGFSLPLKIASIN